LFTIIYPQAKIYSYLYDWTAATAATFRLRIFRLRLSYSSCRYTACLTEQTVEPLSEISDNWLRQIY